LHEYSVQWSGSICDCGTEKIMEAIGVEYRSQTLSTSDSSSSGQYNRYNRRTKAVYAELTVPLIEQGRGEQGQSLELAAASRYEDYSDFGHVTVPRLSFHWNLPIGLEFRGSVGRSIRAPNLPDLNSSRNTVTVGPSPSGAGEVIYLTGNNPNLHEESATNSTLEMLFTKPISDDITMGLDAQLFAIDYYGRIQAP